MKENAKSVGGPSSREIGGVAEQRHLLPFRAVQSLADEVVVHLANRMRIDPAHVVPPIHVDVESFTRALLDNQSEQAAEIILKERRDGVSMEAVYLLTLAGAARLMGEMWLEDRLSFIDMTVATGRIFGMMRGLRFDAEQPMLQGEKSRKALFVTVPGETHTLGVTMAADLFRSRGWMITLRTGLDHGQLAESLSQEHHSVIGISAGHPKSIVALTRLVVALRILQPWAHIIVGGQLVEQVPDLKELIAVDAVLANADDAEEVLAALSIRPPRDQT